MKLEDSVFNQYPHIKLVLSFGVFYFFEKYIIAEINEGVHYDMDKAKYIVNYSHLFYGNDFKVAYISNRVNSYSIDLLIWKEMEKEENQILKASAVVIYDNIGQQNCSFEKTFYMKNHFCCFSLDLAINWVLNLKEFKNSNNVGFLN